MACRAADAASSVAGETVVQDRGRPMRVDRRDALPSGGEFGRDRDRRGGLCFPALKGPEHQQGVGRDGAPGCRRHAVGLGDDGGGSREVAHPGECYAQLGEVERQLCERAGVADKLDLPRGDRMQTIEIPQRRGGDHGHPAPPQDVLDRNAGELLRCTLHRRGRGSVSVCDQQSEAIEQQVEGARSTWRRKGLDGAADLLQDGPSHETLGHPSRAPRGQVCLTRQVRVERLEPAGGRQQQRRSTAAQTRGEGDVSPQHVDPGALELIQRPILRHGCQPERRVERAGLETRLRRGQDTFGVPPSVGGQQHRPLQERRGRSQPAAGLRPPGRPLQLRRDLLIRPGYGLGPVPGAPVRIRDRVGHLGQRRVQLPPVRQRGRPVGR